MNLIIYLFLNVFIIILMIVLQLAVTEADGTPVSGEKVTIRSNSNSGNVYEKLFNVTNGLVQFTIPSVSSSVYKLSIQVTIILFLYNNLDSTCVLIGQQVYFHSGMKHEMAWQYGWLSPS